MSFSFCGLRTLLKIYRGWGGALRSQTQFREWKGTWVRKCCRWERSNGRDRGMRDTRLGAEVTAKYTDVSLNYNCTLGQMRYR